MSAPLRILHLEDDQLDAALIRSILIADGVDCDIVRVATAEDFIAAMQQDTFDLILADHSLPSFDGNTALEIARQQQPQLPFVFVTGTMGEEVAVESLKRGATDYLLKQRLARLPASVRRALAEACERAERQLARDQLEERVRQQEAVANLGQWALKSTDLSNLIRETVDLVAQTLNTQFSTIFELIPNSQTLRICASHGWQADDVGSRTVSFEEDSLVAYVLDTKAPVVIEDIATETRFSQPKHLQGLGVTSSVSVMIGGTAAPFGILGTHSTKLRPFSKDEIYFLQSIANIISVSAERRRGEQSLARQTTELTRSNDELEQFAYVASHDLQEPLRMVSSYLQLLEREYSDKLDEDAKEFIMYAVDGSHRMQTLINNLLEYSRVGTRGRPFEPTDSGAVLTQVLFNLKESKEQSGAIITSGPLPSVVVDSSQLEQLFQNLVANALKFRSKGQPRIHISATEDAFGFTFSVRDNGIGIAPEYADRIFVIFQRLHGRSEYPGTGIGLAICRKIVERHGGRIWVESEDGYGCDFRFTIPRTEANDQSAS